MASALRGGASGSVRQSSSRLAVTLKRDAAALVAKAGRGSVYRGEGINQSKTNKQQIRTGRDRGSAKTHTDQEKAQKRN